MGDDDVIRAGEGNNIVIGGMGSDTITGGSGSGIDVVLGDNGKAVWSAPDVRASFESTAIGDGGNDDIRVGNGDNIVLGGFGTDVIVTGDGSDLILGDNGKFTYTTTARVTKLTRAETTDPDGTTGAADTIVMGGGTTQNIVLAGMGADLVNGPAYAATGTTGTASSGDDIVLGDNGFVTWDLNGVITEFASTLPTLGGNDMVDVGDGKTSFWAALARTTSRRAGR